MDLDSILSLGLTKLAEIISSSILSEISSSIFSSFISIQINLKENTERDLRSIESWSKTMQAFLKEHDGTGGSHILQDQIQQIRTFAYDIDDALDEFRFHVPENIPGRKSTKPDRDAVRKVCSKIKQIREKLEDFNKLDSLRAGNSNYTNTAEDLNYGGEFTLEDGIVGFECETEEITSRLLSRVPQRLLVLLVGPAGSGKTALASHVYVSEKVRSHFDRRHAWVSVSHPLNRQKVLQSILMQLCHGMDKPNLSDKDAILEALQRSLHETSYLVVVDGLWRKDDCECIMDALSRVSQLNRIIVTSRIPDVASSCLNQYEVKLKGLPPEKARTLFCKRAFHTSNGKCPPELNVWTDKVVKKCEGMPMSLVAAGNLLSKKGKTPRDWNYVYDELEAELPIIRRQLLPSYKDLPIHLRFCLSYFSIFPEDYCIERERLIRLWIAEGVIRESASRKLEDVAEDNLNDLIRRNLIHVTARDTDGRVKSCRLLHLVHQFIIRKAEEENFVKIFAEKKTQNSWDRVRRLSIRTNDTEFLKAQNLEKIRSAFLFAEAGCSYLPDFQLLMVLEMQGAAVKSFPKGIVELSLLTYLSLRQTKVSSIPKSIKRLARLETLDLRQTLVSWLPKAIRKLHRLRHLLVYQCEVKGSCRFDSVKGVEISSYLGISNWHSVKKSPGRRRGDVDRVVKECESSIGLAGTLHWRAIQKLSLLKADGMILENLSDFTNLRKLGLVVLRRKDGKKICESIQKMQHLSTLEIMTENEGDYLELDHIPGQPGFINLRRLCLRGGLRKLPGWMCQLPSLIKISLKWSRLNSCPLQPLQTLPNLMQLELVGAYRENSLEFKADTFPKLKVLHIQQLDELSMLVIEEKAIPMLETFNISSCGKLKFQSSGIPKLTHLEKLNLHDMPEDSIGQAERIINECGMKTLIQISHSHALGSNQQFSPETQS